MHEHTRFIDAEVDHHQPLPAGGGVVADAGYIDVAYYVFDAAVGTVKGSLETQALPHLEALGQASIAIPRAPTTGHRGRVAVGVADLTKDTETIDATKHGCGHRQLHGRLVRLTVVPGLQFGVFHGPFLAVRVDGVALERLYAGQGCRVDLLPRVLLDLVKRVLATQGAVLFVTYADVAFDLVIELHVASVPCHHCLLLRLARFQVDCYEAHGREPP